MIEVCVHQFEPRVEKCNVIKWDIEKKQAVLFCIIHLTLKTGATCRCKFSIIGFGKHTLEFV